MNYDLLSSHTTGRPELTIAFPLEMLEKHQHLWQIITFTATTLRTFINAFVETVPEFLLTARAGTESLASVLFAPQR